MKVEDSRGELQNTLHHLLDENENANPLLKRYGELMIAQGPEKLFRDFDEETLLEFLSERFRFADTHTASPFSLHISDESPSPGESGGDYTILDILVGNRPFLIDSIQSYFNTQDVSIVAILHPILHVKRDGKGRIKSMEEYREDGGNEAHIHFILRPIGAHLRQSMLEEVRAILHSVVRSVDDYPHLKGKLEDIRQSAGRTKGAKAVSKLMEWFEEDNFVFMGLLPFKESGKSLQPDLKKGLGLFHPSLHSEPQHEALFSQATRFMDKAAGEKPFLVVEETSIISRMHHRTRLSTLLVSTRSGEGKGEHAVIAGIFTDRSLREDAMGIPVVKKKIGSVVARHGIVPKSYIHKEVMDFFNRLPRFELFRLPEELLERMLAFVLKAVDQPTPEVALMEDAANENVRVMAIVPGRELGRVVMQQIRERVEELFNLTSQNLFSVHMSAFSVLNIVFSTSAETAARLPDATVVENAVREELLTREDRLVRQWMSSRGAGADDRLTRTLVQGLPEEYKLVRPAMEILTDLSRLEALSRSGEPQFVCRSSRGGGTAVILYGWEKLSLSRLMPVFNNLRVLVEEEETFEVCLPDGAAYMHTFRIHPPEGCRIDPDTHQDLMRDLIFNILANRAENNPLNALLLTCGFNWREIGIMQLYRNYLMQVGNVYTKRTINETLIRRTRATRAILGLFRARFDPDLKGRKAAIETAEEEMTDAEREIDNLTEDRIFKSLYNLVLATVRTNFYRDVTQPAIAVKLESAAIEQLPAPRPLYEIYVYGPLMEGIHLRGDRIARGGIRYSDRPDDFRTEVLGLMATQMKKNALIVPLGSKGGFVVKDLAPFGGNARVAGDDQYRAFIGALLSITDNMTGGQVVPPPRVVRRDGDDPYLVVAADKGTAHLSDTANEASMEQGFWLDDAFASGGSNGYDHKVVGVTARGAWESVKRMFWELGVDSQKDPVTVVGVGDMSGDVFGNGMLLSRSLRLMGAFDHRHIFIDPNPDIKASYKERQRLFKLTRSAWSDYDTSLISEGGGIYPRNAKEIPLTPPVREMLGIEETSLSGEAMIRALLSMEVDLLWNGGIGTYVKSSREGHADVGDPNNDAVRIDATQLRARVVGEGGNLGFTQAARIQIDRQGTAIHTDAIDNAGGVNMSDHEVNLKILMAAVIDAGMLEDREARNKLLSELEEPVTAAVLRANFRQVLALSMDRLRSADNMEPFTHMVELLASEGGLDRRTEGIPSLKSYLSARNESAGVPRPVLAVLLAYTKMMLYKRLMEDPLVEDPYLARFYLGYFPQALRERYDLSEVGHALKGQIIATTVTNLVIDQAGICFVPETATHASATWGEVVQAYLLADAVVEGAAYREQVYAVASVMPAALQYRLLMELEGLLGEFVRWLLLNRVPSERTFAAEPELRDAFRTYCGELPNLLEAGEMEKMTAAAEKLKGDGLPPAAQMLASQVPFLRGFPYVSGLAAQGGLSLGDAFRFFHAVEGVFRFAQLESALTSLRFGDVMQKRFGDNLLRSLSLQRQAKLGVILEKKDPSAAPEEWVAAYLEACGRNWTLYEATMRQVLDQKNPEAVSLAVVIGQLEAV